MEKQLDSFCDEKTRLEKIRKEVEDWANYVQHRAKYEEGLNKKIDEAVLHAYWNVISLLNMEITTIK